MTPSYELWTALLSLLLGSLVVMGSPGPSTISATAVGAAFGFRRSLPYCLGLILGTTAVLIAVACGIVSLLLSVPQLAHLLILGSALYMVYLALKIATAPPLSEMRLDTAAPSFVGGFLLAVSNPKAFLAIAAVFASSSLGFQSRLIEAALTIAVLAAMIVAIHVFWLMAGVSFSRLLRHPVSSRIVNISLAAILVVTAGLALIRI